MALTHPEIALILKYFREYLQKVSLAEKKILITYFKESNLHSLHNLIKNERQNTYGYNINIVQGLLTRIELILRTGIDAEKIILFYEQVLKK